MSKKRPEKVKASRVAIDQQETGYFFSECTFEMTVNGKKTVRTERIERRLVNGQWVDVNNNQVKGS